jgi:hypothetical protein
MSGFFVFVHLTTLRFKTFAAVTVLIITRNSGRIIACYSFYYFLQQHKKQLSCSK